MSLREEIEELYWDENCSIVICHEIINKVREYYGYKDSDITMIGSAHEADIRADERNKVLDAAVEAVDQMYKDIVFNQDHVYRCLLARCRTKKDAIEAINKLRRD